MNKFQLILNGVLIAGITILFILYFIPTEKTGYIRTAEVFNSFTLKKEYEVKFHKVEKQREYILDSIKLSLSSLYKQIQNEKDKNRQKELISIFQARDEQFRLKEKQFKEDNLALMNKYDSQIFSQLNQYVKDYGEANSYKFILGATGEGNVMYADDAEDITREVSAYINLRYEGH